MRERRLSMKLTVYPKIKSSQAPAKVMNQCPPGCFISHSMNFIFCLEQYTAENGDDATKHYERQDDRRKRTVGKRGLQGREHKDQRADFTHGFAGQLRNRLPERHTGNKANGLPNRLVSLAASPGAFRSGKQKPWQNLQ